MIVDCELSTGDASEFIELPPGEAIGVALQDVVALPFGGIVKLDCKSIDAAAYNASLIAVRVGAIHS